MAFDTPKAQKSGSMPQYSQREKEMILANFDLEVTARRKRIVQRLEEELTDFYPRHSKLLSNIPRALRSMTVEEFATKYDGSIRAFMEAGTQAKTRDMAGVGLDIEASVRKRKQPVDTTDGAGPSKSHKAARKVSASPTKPREGGGNDSNATPKPYRGLPSRTPSGKPSALSRARFASSSQPVVVRQPSTSIVRPPASAEFNPSLPAKTPAYPRQVKSNDVLLSANGSPIANPWTLRPSEIQATEISLNSPPMPRMNTFFLTFRTREGTVLKLDPNLSPDKNADFVGLPDNEKREVKDNMLRLAEKMGGFKL